MDFQPFYAYLQQLSTALKAGNATEHTHRPALKALGSYQVLSKWLKDCKGRVLQFDDFGPLSAHRCRAPAHLANPAGN